MQTASTQTAEADRQRRMKRPAAALTVLGAVAIALFAVPLASHVAASRDFVSYWAAGRQLAHHADPYDLAGITQIERAAGIKPPTVLFMRNPPWALPLAWPLGFLRLSVAGFLWALLLIGCLVLSVLVVRRLHGAPSNVIQWIGLTFTPALICLAMGQTALFSLLGLALFLRFHKQRPFTAGAALWLCALKPHLFLPFGVALAAWVVYSRAWKLLAGAAAALGASLALTFLLDPRAWPDYLHMMRSPAVENDFIPCWADAARYWIRPHSAGVQYLPATLACIWALVYFWRRRAHWDWMDGGSLLMLVSLLVAPYAWIYDQCLAIPALLHAAYRARARAWVIFLVLTVLVADLQFSKVNIATLLWLWTVPVWLIWYLLATRSGSATHAQQYSGVAIQVAPDIAD